MTPTDDLGRPLHEILLRRGLITEQQWQEALRLDPDAPLQVLIDRGWLSQTQLAKAKAARVGLEFRVLAAPPDPALQTELPRDIRTSGLCAVLESHDDHIVVAVSDPDPVLRDALRDAVHPKRLEIVVVTPDQLPPPSEESGEQTSASSPPSEVTALTDLTASPLVVRLLAKIINGAIDAGASDIHIVTRAHRCEALYRIDGQLQPGVPIPGHTMPGIIGRIKILAGLDISIHQTPQSGKILWTYGARGSRQYDLRVEVCPDVRGEHAVLRIFGHASKTSLDELGFPPDIRDRLDELASLPYGLVLVCGPTGSGKSTTLGVLLRRVRQRFRGKSIFTIEHPVEQYIPDIVQIPVYDHGPRSFATILRSVLRQDPDVIMIGEIRDPETAEIAVQAALTGHLVLSTLHTNTAPGAIPRLINLGVAPYLIGYALQAALSQRLLRRTCTFCARETPLEGADLVFARLHGLGTTERRGTGCDRCYGGYRGRIAIGELLILPPSVRSRITDHTTEEDVREWTGIATMVQNGLVHVRNGLTTVEELRRAAWTLDEVEPLPVSQDGEPRSPRLPPAPVIESP